MIHADEKLPGFARCFDMGFMRQALEDGLPALGQVRSCRLERFRYRRQSRASFLYQVEAEGRTGWISGSLYKGDKSRGIFEAAAGHPATGFAASLGMVLEEFPHDRKLGLASDLVAGRCSEVLDTIAPLFGGSPLSVTEILPVRYRPRIAAVFRLAVSSGSESRRLYVKIYADEDVGATRDRLTGCQDGARFSILRPAAVLKRSNAIVWPEAEGVSLAQSMASGGDIDALRRGADALAEFHLSRQVLPSVSPNQYARDDAARHAAFISSLVPELAAATDTLVREIPAPFGDEPVGPFHHDMKPEHALLGSSATNLIDVEGIALGDPAFDVGNMLARISSSSWLYGSPVNHSKRAFDAFFCRSAHSLHGRGAAAFALGKMKLATYAISHQIDNWAVIAESELKAGLSALESGTLA